MLFPNTLPVWNSELPLWRASPPVRSHIVFLLRECLPQRKSFTILPGGGWSSLCQPAQRKPLLSAQVISASTQLTRTFFCATSMPKQQPGQAEGPESGFRLVQPGYHFAPVLLGYPVSRSARKRLTFSLCDTASSQQPHWDSFSQTRLRPPASFTSRLPGGGETVHQVDSPWLLHQGSTAVFNHATCKLNRPYVSLSLAWQFLGSLALALYRRNLGGWLPALTWEQFLQSHGSIEPRHSFVRKHGDFY